MARGSSPGRRSDTPFHAAERTNDVWLWHVIPIPGGVPYGTAPDLEPAKDAFREARMALKAADPSKWVEWKARASTTGKRDAGADFTYRLVNQG